VEAATSVSVGKVSENESHDHGRVFEPAAFDFTHFASEADAVGLDFHFCDCFVYHIVLVYEARLTEYQCAVMNSICIPYVKIICGMVIAVRPTQLKIKKKCISEVPVIYCKLTFLSNICCWIIQVAKFDNRFHIQVFFFI